MLARVVGYPDRATGIALGGVGPLGNVGFRDQVCGLRIGGGGGLRRDHRGFTPLEKVASMIEPGDPPSAIIRPEPAQDATWLR